MLLKHTSLSAGTYFRKLGVCCKIVYVCVCIHTSLTENKLSGLWQKAKAMADQCGKKVGARDAIIQKVLLAYHAPRCTEPVFCRCWFALSTNSYELC